MSYEKKMDQVGLDDGEAAVLLDSGELVAVSCYVKRQVNTHNPVYCAKARAIKETGETIKDAHGYPIFTEMRHSACDQEVRDIGDNELRRECMLLVLGEPPTLRAFVNGEQEPLVGWDAPFRVTVSIRRAVAVAAQTSVTSAHLL